MQNVTRRHCAHSCQPLLCSSRVAAMQNVTRRLAALVPTIARTRRHLATQKQGDWTAVAARDYASHRQTFQADYARECWQRLSSRPAVAPVVARAARVLDVGCGSGEFTRELASHLPHASIVGVDISEGMVRHAERANAHERVSYAVIDFANQVPFRGESFQVATSTMALHWPGPDAAFLAGVSRFIEPGGVFLAGLHGQGSCQEGVDAFEKVAGLDLESLPTMFKRRSAAAWEKALCDAGFFDVEVEERTVATRYASVEDCQRRLAAAWPPILAGHVPAADVDALVAAAARAMMDAGGVMTSRLLEFSAFDSGVPDAFRP
ncbi:unnamed protein product [Pelagomonas calceolata]|uniref:Methyltransferase domain-containing protein n=1 Tax=Pelagomonas calceolata TaxID=35677 RepID=A0A8J2SL23_9STRA|nr:unnamed protein product [Pelagomonas calceolata]